MALTFPSSLCFFRPSFVNLCSEPLAEVLSFLVVNTVAQLETRVPPDQGRCPSHRGLLLEVGWGLQEAPWPGRRQPGLPIRIPLGAFRKCGWPGPTLDPSKLNQRGGPGLV